MENLLLKFVVQSKMPKAIIMEDDVSPKNNFSEVLWDVWNNYLPDDFDIIMLGSCAGYMNEPTGKLDALIKKIELSKTRQGRQVNKYLRIPHSLTGTQGYIISFQGAQKLLNKIKSISHHVDLVFKT